MASKQLGKLRQWAGEVISSRDKTTVSEEFQELEKDIELRREGLAKLLVASGTYQHVLSKKKKNAAFENVEVFLPIDALGIVMVMHGEEYGDDSAFGTALMKFGRAHCKVATLQEAYALTLKDTFLSSLEKFIDEIKEYDTHRKKLDSRRLSYDAALAKFEKLKNGKKEKEKWEAEDEMEKARQRYEETSDEVQAQMHAIQDKEIAQLQELTAFLNLEIGFVEQYLNVLKDVKDGWNNGPSPSQQPLRHPAAIAHMFPRPGSAQSRASNRSQSRTRSDSGDEPMPRNRKLSKSKRSDSISSKPPSRPSSRASRKRADSAATVGDKEEKPSRRMSVAGWASSAVDSVTGRSKKSRDRDKFATLDDNDDSHDRELDGGGSPPKKSSSFHSLTSKLSREKFRDTPSLSKGSGKILKPPSLQGKKVVRAMRSFSGGADELSFETGDEIVVVNEVLDGWWMGELQGKKGLFPTTHVEPVPANNPTSRHRSRRSRDYPSSSFSPTAGLQQHVDSTDSDSYISSERDYDEDLGRQPLSAHHAAQFFGGPSDTASIDGSFAEDEDSKFLIRNTNSDSGLGSGGDEHLPQKSRSETHLSPLMPPRTFERAATAIGSVSSGTSTGGKKIPPPPPPRRTHATPGPTPPVPARPSKSHSHSSSQQLKAPTPASSVSSHGYDRSPFESTTSLSTPDTVDSKCTDFKQSSFQAKGMCSNCFQFHGER